MAARLRPTKQSSQLQIDEEDPASFADLSALSEAINQSSHDESVSMGLEDQVKLKGFIRLNSGETRFAGQPYKLLLVANPKGGVGKSTLCVLLAAFSGLEKLQFADIDPQQSTKLAFEALFGDEAVRRSLLDIESLKSLQEAAKQAAGTDRQTILVDTPAGLDLTKVVDARIVSLVLVPVSSSSVELREAFKFISSLQERNYPVPILIVPNKVNDNADLLKIISMFKALPCMLASPIPYDRTIERLLADQHFPGDLADLQEAAFPLIQSINTAIKAPYLIDSGLKQIT